MGYILGHVVGDFIMLRSHELIYDWYTSSTLVEEPTSSLIDTCFIEVLAYKYGIHHFVVLMHGDVWYTHIWHILDWYYLITTTIGICLIHGYGTCFMMETYRE
jgi:hypothetical protein